MSRSFSPPRISPSRWLLATGLALLAMVACATTLVTGLRARSWTEIPATMTAFELVSGHKGRKHLVVRYEYSFQGAYFTGTRFGFSDGFSREELAGQYASGRRVQCFVNPLDPAESLLRRDMGRIHWFLPLILLGAAAGLGLGAKRAYAQQRLADSATLYSLETGHVPARDKAA